MEIMKSQGIRDNPEKFEKQDNAIKKALELQKMNEEQLYFFDEIKDVFDYKKIYNSSAFGNFIVDNKIDIKRIEGLVSKYNEFLEAEAYISNKIFLLKKMLSGNFDPKENNLMRDFVDSVFSLPREEKEVKLHELLEEWDGIENLYSEIVTKAEKNGTAYYSFKVEDSKEKLVFNVLNNIKNGNREILYDDLISIKNHMSESTSGSLIKMPNNYNSDVEWQESSDSEGESYEVTNVNGKDYLRFLNNNGEYEVYLSGSNFDLLASSLTEDNIDFVNIELFFNKKEKLNEFYNLNRSELDVVKKFYLQKLSQASKVFKKSVEDRIDESVKNKHTEDSLDGYERKNGLEKKVDTSKIPSGISISIKSLKSKTANVIDRGFNQNSIIEDNKEYQKKLSDSYFDSLVFNLKRYKRIIDSRFSEVDYYHDKIEIALKALQKNPPKPVFFYGDYGTGKTALAEHISRTRFGKEPEVVNCNKYDDPSRYTEEFKVSVLAFSDRIKKIVSDNKLDLDIDLNEILQNKDYETFLQLEGIIKDALQKKIDIKKATEISDSIAKESDSLSKQIFDRLENDLSSKQIEGRYVLGGLYRCMNEGRPFIMDEANALPPEVFIAFNYAMTRKIGEKIQTRTDLGEIEVKKGFCIIMTGNEGGAGKFADNKARYKFDAATNSRITSIEIDYPPQDADLAEFRNKEVEKMRRFVLADNVENNYESIFASVMNESDESLRELITKTNDEINKDQIYQILVSRLVNKRGGLRCLVKKGENGENFEVFKDFQKLAMGSKIIMNLFSKKLDGLKNTLNLQSIQSLINSTSVDRISENLIEGNDTNASIRELMDNIISEYKKDSMRMPLEYYIFGYIQRLKYDPSMNKFGKVIVYEIFRQLGFFKVSEGWPDIENIKTKEECKEIFDRDFSKLVDGKEPPAGYHISSNGKSAVTYMTDDSEFEYRTRNEMKYLILGIEPPLTEDNEYNELGEMLNSIKSDDISEDEIDREAQNIADSIGEIVGSYSSPAVSNLIVTNVTDNGVLEQSFNGLSSCLSEIKSKKVEVGPIDILKDEWRKILENFIIITIDFVNSIKRLNNPDSDDLVINDENVTISQRLDMLKNELSNEIKKINIDNN